VKSWRPRRLGGGLGGTRRGGADVNIKISGRVDNYENRDGSERDREDDDRDRRRRSMSRDRDRERRYKFFAGCSLFSQPSRLRSQGLFLVYV